MIGLDEDAGPGGGPNNPLHALIGAGLIVAIALLGLSIVQHERALDTQRSMLRDPAIHRYQHSVVIRPAPDVMPAESDCPEVEVQLLC